MHCNLLAWVAAQNDLPLNLQGFLLRLTRLADSDGKLSMTQAQIAPLVSLSERQTRTLLGEAVTAGAIIRARRGGAGGGRVADLLTFNQARNATGAMLPEAMQPAEDATDQAAPVAMLRGVATGNTEQPATGSIPPVATATGNCPPVSNSSAPYKERAGAGADSKLLTKEEDKIRSEQKEALQARIVSDQIPVSKERIDSLIDRAGDACDPTAPSLHHGADLNRLLRGGCDWIDDILPAVDRLAASFRRRGKRFSTWELITEHATDFRDRRLRGLPPAQPSLRRDPPRNGVRRNLHLEAIACARA